MDLEPFSQGNSFLHRADSRHKLLAALSFSLITASLNNDLSASLALLVALFFLALTRLSPLLLVKRFFFVNLFTLFIWCTLPLAWGAEGLELNQAGFSLAWLITLKTNAIVAMLIALVATSSVSRLGQALQALAVPDKLCLLLVYTYRYIFVLSQEFQRLRRAASLRGFVPGTNMHTYKTFANLIAMTLVRGWARSSRVEQAMVLRGFSGRFHVLHVRRAQPHLDWALLLALLLVSGALLYVELWVVI